MLDLDEMNQLGLDIRAVLRRAKQPLALDEIARQCGASRYDIHDALSINLHGWIEMRDNKYRLL